MLIRRLSLAIVAMGVLALLGCGGHGSGLATAIPGASSGGGGQTSSENLPAPAQLKDASAWLPGIENVGSEYPVSFPHARAQAIGAGQWSYAELSPQCAPGTQRLDQAAFVVYAFNTTGYSLDNTLRLNWLQQGGNIADVWIGLTDFRRNAWCWFSLPADGALPYDPAYLSPDGDLAVAVVVLGSDVWQLEHIGLTTVDHPFNLSASDGEHYSLVKLNWEFPAESAAPSSYQIFRADAQDGPYTQIGSVDAPATSYDDATAVNLQQYWYKVRASSDAGGKGSSSIDGEFGNSDSGMGGGYPPECWPMYGHDPQQTHRANVSGPRANTLAWSYLAEGPGLEMYDASVGPDGTIYASGYDGLYAINPDGTLKWKTVDQPWNDPVNSYEGGAPCIAGDGSIYYVNPSGAYALNSDGTLKWTDPRFSENFGARQTIAPNGNIYMLSWSTSSSAYNLLKVYEPDGTLLWTQGGIMDSPAPVAIDHDGTVYLAGQYPGYLDAYLPDGSTKWSTWFALWADVFSNVCLAPNNQLYVAAGDGWDTTLYSLDASGSPVGTGVDFPRTIQSITADASSNLYFGCRDDKFYCLNPDLSERWTYATGTNTCSPPVIASDGTIYFTSWDGGYGYPFLGNYLGALYALKPNGEAKWVYDLQDMDASLGTPCLSADESMIYFTSLAGKCVYAIESSGALGWIFTPGAQIYCPPVTSPEYDIYFRDTYHGVSRLDQHGQLTMTSDVCLGAYSGLAVAPDGLIQLLGYTTKTQLVALSQDGAGLWFSPGLSVGWGPGLIISPVMDNFGSAYLASNDQISCFDGQLAATWSSAYPGAAYWGDVPTTMAVAPDGKLFVGVSDRDPRGIVSVTEGYPQAFYTDNALMFGPPSIVALTPVDPGPLPYLVCFVGQRDLGSGNLEEQVCVLNQFGTLIGSYTSADYMPPSTAAFKIAVGPEGTLYVGLKDQLVALDLDATVLWVYPTSGYPSTPAVDKDGYVYFGCGDQMTCLTPNGTLSWSSSCSAHAGEPMIANDGSLIFGSTDHRVYCIGPGGDV